MNLSQTIELQAGGPGSGRHKGVFKKTDPKAFSKLNKNKEFKKALSDWMNKETSSYKTTKVNFNQLIATQNKFYPEVIKEWIALKHFSDPIVYKFKDKLYVKDGHHRAIAQKEMGKKQAKIQMVDLDKMKIH